MSEKSSEQLEKIDITRGISRGWKQFTRTWWLFLLLVFLGMVSFAFYQKKAHTDIYEAYASFSVSSGSGTSNYNNQISLNQLGETFPYILESGALKTVVMEELNLSWLPVTISASVIEDTNLFRISVTGTDPQMCADVLDSVMENYPTVAKYVIGRTTMTTLDYSGVPAAPINRLSMRNILAQGAAIGLIIYSLILLVLTLARKTVENEDDLKKYTSLRCLSVIPEVYIKRRSSRKQAGILINQKQVSQAFRESINLLRIRVLREMDKKHKKVLLITSTGELEGKSTVSANLALSCTLKGFRVLLVDGDLRHPSVASGFAMNPQAGIHDVLTGKIPLENAVYTYKDTSLDLLCGHGTADTKNISQLLTGDMIRNILSYAREHYDYIFIDSPPCSLMQDAIMWSAHADSAIIVIRQDYLARSQILNTIDTLSESGVDLTGCVINGDSGSPGSYGYGRYGYGNYGYGKYGNYGKYGDSESAKTKMR